MRSSKSFLRFFFAAFPAMLLAIAFVPISGGYPLMRGGQSQPPQGRPYLVFSTYLGGATPFASGNDALTFAQNTASDTQGNIYVTGATQVCDLPVLNACQPTPWAGSTMSAFVAKYAPAGNLLWCTYLGGNKQSMGLGVAVMPDGGVAVAGLTSSDADGPFPTINSFQPKNNGKSDYFVTVYDASGYMQYSTYLGGSGLEGGPGKVFVDDGSSGNDIAVDSQGLVYVTGVTPSGSGDAIEFPVTPNAIQTDLKGSTDAFLTIMAPHRRGASSLVYSSFLGGDHGEQGHSVAVNAGGGQITVAGYTRSSDFPTTANAYRSYPAPSGYYSNGFITQFASSLPGDASSVYSIAYSTYLGADESSARDDTYRITLEPNGIIVATGRTQSAGFPMVESPVAAIYDSAPYLEAGTSGDEPYLVKIDPLQEGKASLIYSTFLGGGSPQGDWGSFCTGVTVDSDGTAYVGGETWAPGVEYAYSITPAEAPSMFPYTENALFPALQGAYDAMLMQVGPSGASLGYSTFLGGTQNDRAYGLTVDPSHNVILSGLTFSADFPMKNPAQTWPGNTGNQDAFLTKFNMNQGPTLVDLATQKVQFQTTDSIKICADVWPVSTPSYLFIRIVTPDGSIFYYESGKGLMTSPVPYLGFAAGPVTSDSPILGYLAIAAGFSGIAPGTYVLEGGAVNATKTTSASNPVYFGAIAWEELTVR